MDVERNTIMDSMISKGERLLPAMFGGAPITEKGKGRIGNEIPDGGV